MVGYIIHICCANGYQTSNAKPNWYKVSCAAIYVASTVATISIWIRGKYAIADQQIYQKSKYTATGFFIPYILYEENHKRDIILFLCL